MAKGLKVGVTAMLTRRALHLDGLHILKLFFLVEKSNLSVHCTAELAIQYILTKNKLCYYYR